MTTTTPASVVRINPTLRRTAFGFDQAQLRTMPAQLLTIAGQGPVDDDGNLLHEGDVCAQLSLTMRHISTVLDAADMTFADIIRISIYTTDVDATLAAYGAILEHLAPVGATPPATLLGVTRLAIPGMAVEIDVTAAR
jgi:enamine deaminase RidA (YjgF/YER057c/UK114 family)